MTTALLLAAAAAAPGLPPGMTPALFASTRVQNMVDRANGRGAVCPPIRKVSCGAGRTVGTADFRGTQYQCRFEEKRGRRWLKTEGVLANFGGNWDFNARALAACRYR